MYVHDNNVTKFVLTLRDAAEKPSVYITQTHIEKSLVYTIMLGLILSVNSPLKSIIGKVAR